MTIENTVSIDFLSAFVDCEEGFLLPPTRSDFGHRHLGKRKIN